MYWLVCDATQRLTLEKDNHGNFWWDLYREAVEQNSENQYYFAEFSAHRAALYSNPTLPVSQVNLNYAKLNYEKFLKKTESASEYNFYKIIYYSLALRFSSIDKNDLFSLSHEMFEYLSYPQMSHNYLTGEWKSFVTPFDKRKQSVVGITSSINALIYNNDIAIAIELYNDACNKGLPRNRYIEARLT